MNPDWADLRPKRKCWWAWCSPREVISTILPCTWFPATTPALSLGPAQNTSLKWVYGFFFSFFILFLAASYVASVFGTPADLSPNEVWRQRLHSECLTFIITMFSYHTTSFALGKGLHLTIFNWCTQRMSVLCRCCIPGMADRCSALRWRKFWQRSSRIWRAKKSVVSC